MKPIKWKVLNTAFNNQIRAEVDVEFMISRKLTAYILSTNKVKHKPQAILQPNLKRMKCFLIYLGLNTAKKTLKIVRYFIKISTGTFFPRSNI